MSNSEFNIKEFFKILENKDNCGIKLKKIL